MAKENANMAARYEREIPEGYEARIEGNKVIIEKKEDVDEKIRKSIVDFIWRIANGAFNRGSMPSAAQCQEWLSYLEKQKALAAIPDELVKNYKLFREQGGRELALLVNAINGFNKLKEQQPVECNEDERIRKEIIDWMKGGNTYDWQENKEKWIAYLERPKNERELSFIEGEVEGIRQTCQEIKDAMSLYEPKDLTPFESTFRGYVDSAIRYCLSGEGYQQYIKEWSADLLNLEKQKELKPIPKFKVGDCIYDKRDSYNRNVIREVGKDYYINAFAQKMDMVYTDANFEFLEHLDDDIIPNKPAEWSEDIICKAVKEVGLTQHQINWLKNNVFQPKQEWSEEDEKMLNELLDHCNTENARWYNWLKSLRPQPHWKPSEEQMNRLGSIIAALRKDFCDDMADFLASLLYNLKKLM